MPTQTIRALRLVLTVIVASLFSGARSAAQDAGPGEDFDSLVRRGAQALAENRLADAIEIGDAAVTKKPEDDQGYALVALALQRQGQTDQARNALARAIARAPGDKLAHMDKVNEDLLPSADRIKHDALLLIIDDSDAAKTTPDQQRLLAQFLEASAPFLQTHDEQIGMWVLRAKAALQLNRPRDGYQAGQRLLAWGAADSQDDDMRHLLARLEHNGWLKEDFLANLDKQEQREQQRQAAAAEQARTELAQRRLEEQAREDKRRADLALQEKKTNAQYLRWLKSDWEGTFEPLAGPFSSDVNSSEGSLTIDVSDDYQIQIHCSLNVGSMDSSNNWSARLDFDSTVDASKNIGSTPLENIRLKHVSGSVQYSYSDDSDNITSAALHAGRVFSRQGITITLDNQKTIYLYKTNP